jgi:hypothetical protein
VRLELTSTGFAVRSLSRLATRAKPNAIANRKSAIANDLELLAGVEPAYFQLRFTRLEDETGTGALGLVSGVEPLSTVYKTAALPIELHQH